MLIQHGAPSLVVSRVLLGAYRDLITEWSPLDNICYMMSPRDIVLARPRDMDDRITWLLDRNRCVVGEQARLGGGGGGGVRE